MAVATLPIAPAAITRNEQLAGCYIRGKGSQQESTCTAMALLVIKASGQRCSVMAIKITIELDVYNSEV